MTKSIISLICFLTLANVTMADDSGQNLTVPSILDASAMKDGQRGNPTVDPCEDFYQFSCGQWIDTTVIPAEKKAVSRQATIPLELTDVVLNKILEKYAQGDFSTPSSQAKQLGAFYNSCMTYDKSTETSLTFVKKQIESLKALNSKSQLPKVIALSQTLGMGAFFSFGSEQDPADSNRFIGNIAQGGISLPEKDYYLATDDDSVKIRADYKKYIKNLFTLFGWSPMKAANAASAVLKIETALAQVSLSLEDRYDTAKTVHISSVDGLQKAYPEFDWKTFFQTSNVSEAQLARFNIEEPDFFAGLSTLLKTESLENIKFYMIFKLIDNSAGKLAGSYEQAHFGFWDKRLNGVAQPLPRWKYCTQEVENTLGYALAEAYVKSFDGAEIKKKTETMISSVKDAFQTDLISLTQGPDAWLDQETYAGALEKIQLMGQKVGGPEKWRDYSQLEKQGSNFLFNTLYVTKFEVNRDYKKMGSAVDRTEWYMMPWEFNAYYDPANNEFNFPFGILQPPSLDFTATEGANLGSFGGGTIGHELTHGFDNSGSQYDAHGNIKNWWSAVTQAKFDQKAQCFIDQAGQYTIKEVNLAVDGKQTLTENLADQGGVKLGYTVLDQNLQKRAEGAIWNGYSERQQYWIAYAQSWCTKSRPESLRVQMSSDPHPPAEFRVNAIVMNRPEFARDFKCVAGAKMAPVNRCSIW